MLAILFRMQRESQRPFLRSGLKDAASPAFHWTGMLAFVVEHAGLCSPASAGDCFAHGETLPMGESALGFPCASPAAAAAVLPASAVPPLAPSTSRLTLSSMFVSMTLRTAAGGVTEGNRGPGRPSFSTFLVISIASLAVLSSDAKLCKGESF